MVVTSWSWSSDLSTKSGVGQLQLFLSYPSTGSCRCSCMWVSTLTNSDSLYSGPPTVTPTPSFPIFEAMVCPVTSLWIFGFFCFYFYFFLQFVWLFTCWDRLQLECLLLARDKPEVLLITVNFLK